MLHTFGLLLHLIKYQVHIKGHLYKFSSKLVNLAFWCGLFTTILTFGSLDQRANEAWNKSNLFPHSSTTQKKNNVEKIGTPFSCNLYASFNPKSKHFWKLLFLNIVCILNEDDARFQETLWSLFDQTRNSCIKMIMYILSLKLSNWIPTQVKIEHGQK